MNNSVTCLLIGIQEQEQADDMATQFVLLKDRRFLPLFVTQFLGALNDNLLKSYMVVLIAYGLWDVGAMRPDILVSLATALFIFPFIIFAPFAGSLTDRFDKALVIRCSKIAEIGIVLVAIFAIYAGSTLWAYVLLFLMGTQSAFFAPGKLSILPQHLKQEELIGANALISTSTYIAILAGTLGATLLATMQHGFAVLSGMLVACSLVGYLASRYIPHAPPCDKGARLSINPFFDIGRSLAYAWKRPEGVFVIMLSISWFYFVAGALHAQFPNYAKMTLGVDTDVLAVFMVTFSVGVGLGGLLNNRVLRASVSNKFVPFAALAIAVFCADLYFSSVAFQRGLSQGDGGALIGIGVFLSGIEGWRILFDLFFLSVAGGLYVVPLRAMIQIKTPSDHIARVVAANALTDSLFLLVSSLVAAFLLSMGCKVVDLFLMLAIATLIVALSMIVSKQIQRKIVVERNI